MKITLLFTLLLLSLFSPCLAEPFITKELLKNVAKTANWQATTYEDNVFKGMHKDEVTQQQQQPIIVWADDDVPTATKRAADVHSENVASINWLEKGANCVHDIKTQGECEGASFAFSIAGMISDRCCLRGKDHGWLSTMEILSCSRDNYGCTGGWPAWAMQYTVDNGLVDEACYPYVGLNEACPNKCKTNKDWKASHVCKCANPVTLPTLESVKAALVNGPVVVTFEAYDDFFAYKSGIYCHQAGGFQRLLSARVVGYSEETQPHLILAMSFGPNFGEKGYVRMCTTCCGMFGKYEKGNVACDPTP